MHVVYLLKIVQEDMVYHRFHYQQMPNQAYTRFRILQFVGFPSLLLSLFHQLHLG